MLLLHTHHPFLPSAICSSFHWHLHKNRCFIPATRILRRRPNRRRIENHPPVFSLRPNGRTLPTEDFCIIEGPETVMDFAFLQLQEIQENIKSRRNAIFLLLEEVRRLRIQLRIKSMEEKSTGIEEDGLEYKSFIPFLPLMTPAALRQYYATCLILMIAIIMFGGLVAPLLELKLGIGGTSYRDFINNVHLPLQLSQVDPIVASFSGGAVGVISSLMIIEINNVKQQEEMRCRYCNGTGYLACARCSATGLQVSDVPNGQSLASKRCSACAGSAKVMCPTCFCTGMAMANENDPRFDPFD